MASVSVHDNLAASRYENKVPCLVDKVPVDEDTMTVRQAREHKESERQRARDQRNAWRIEEARMDALLRMDLEKEHGVAGSAKAEKLWSLAWEHGHSNGYESVIFYYEDFAELVAG